MKCSLLCALLTWMFCCGCSGVFVNDKMVDEVDSLNDRAHDFRYVSIDSCAKYSAEAYEKSGGYVDGRHQALLNKAFSEYMRMDFEEAMSMCKSVLDDSNNELVCLMANVHLMRISALTAANKDFFYYRNNALNNMKRIEMDEELMTERQRRLWRLALSEFHIVSSEYYYSLRQEAEANDEIEMLEGDVESMIADSVQMARLILLKSVNDIFVGGDESSSKFRNVVRAYRIGREKNALYLCAKSLQMLALELARTDSLAEYRVENIKGLLDKREVANDTLALALSMEALEMSREYGSLYMESFSYLSASDCYFYKENYVKSLEYAEKALGLINEYQCRYAGCETELYMCSDVTDSVSTEMVWINDPAIITLPEWMAEVRERLSMIYSALGDKAGADYNRNIYLDILDATRQDMRMQQRLDSLADEKRSLDWALAVCGGVIMLIVLLLVFAVRRQKRNNNLQRRRLLEVIDDCKEFLSLSLKSGNSEKSAVELRLAEVDDKELKPVIDVFTDWVEHNKCISGELDDLQRKIESENYLFEKRIEEKKRDNISKLICMSVINGIAPFMDRAIKEIEKLKVKVENNQKVDNQKDLDYLSELIDKINDYNDVVSRWVMMRQGTVNLNVENFALQPMFEIIGKNRNLFEAKGLTLKIDETPLVVKADMALTFFMINTLMDNARKYTEKGGCVRLGAEETENGGVRVFIEDTGRGLSETDIDTIVNEKVYDSSNIGNPGDNEDLRKNKGFGFGLMSCKGIIEKYRKTSPVFSVCRFGVLSELGKGSTFSFTLPKGVLRSLEMLILIIVLPFTLSSCAKGDGSGVEVSTVHNDTIVSDTMLRNASYYADQAYYSNVQGDYASALVYADSAINELNRYHLKEGMTSRMMTLDGRGVLPDEMMYAEGVKTDYHIILDIRNEAAIAALALNRWSTYHYNNEIYTRLYKIMAQDDGLEDYCDEIEKANVNKQTLLLFVLIAVFLVLIVIFLIYYKNTVLPILNMRQLLWMNRKVYAADTNVYGNMDAEGCRSVIEGRDFSNSHYQNYVNTLYECVTDIKNSDGVALYINKGDDDNGVFVFSSECPEPEYLKDLMLATFEKAEVIVGRNERIRVFPLFASNEDLLIGAFAVAFHSAGYTNNDDIVFRLVAQFTALNIYSSDMLIESQLQDIEVLEDQRRKAQYEENMIHVQNQIIDNCLSTIKHETMYYPNRIKLIVDKIRQRHEVEVSEIEKMQELMLYYKDIYSILHRYASRQLETTLFKRRKITISAITDYVQATFRKIQKRYEVGLNMQIEFPGADFAITGDEHLVQYLFYTLLLVSFENKSAGTISLGFEKSDGFVKFAFTDNRGMCTSEKLNSLFYPDTLATADDDEIIRRNMQMLICKQIIREHDEYSGHRGCRINAFPNEEGTGYKLVFTLPTCGV